MKIQQNNTANFSIHSFNISCAVIATKLEENLGCTTEENIKSGIIKSVEWYLKKYNKGEYE